MSLALLVVGQSLVILGSPGHDVVAVVAVVAVAVVLIKTNPEKV